MENRPVHSNYPISKEGGQNMQISPPITAERKILHHIQVAEAISIQPWEDVLRDEMLVC